MKLSIYPVLVPLLLLIACGEISAQKTRTLVLLIPATVSVDPTLREELQEAQEAMKRMKEAMIEDATSPAPGDSPRWRAMKENWIRSYQRFSFRNFLVHMATTSYLYELHRDTSYLRHEEPTVHMEFDSSATDKASLRAKAKKYNCRFLVNFPELQIYRSESAIRGTLQAQLYDAASDAIVIDSVYRGLGRNTGELMDCAAERIECAMIIAATPFFVQSSEYMNRQLAAKGTRRRK